MSFSLIHFLHLNVEQKSTLDLPFWWLEMAKTHRRYWISSEVPECLRSNLHPLTSRYSFLNEPIYCKIVYKEEKIHLWLIVSGNISFSIPSCVYIEGDFSNFQRLCSWIHPAISKKKKKKQANKSTVTHEDSATVALILCWLLCSLKSFQASYYS